MAKTFAEILQESEGRVNTALTAAQEALRGGNITKYGKAKAKLEKAVDEYNTNVRNSLHEEFMASGTPFVAFAKQFTYSGKRVKETKDKTTQIVNGVNVDSVDRRLNIKEFIEKRELDSSILTDMTKLLTLLTIREKGILTLTHEQLAKESPYFCRVVKAKQSGGTPDSNTQICRAIQGIMEKCGISCRVINPDMAYIQQCAFVHNAKEKCSVKPVTVGKFQTILVDVMNHFVEGTAYSVFEKLNAELEATAETAAAAA